MALLGTTFVQLFSNRLAIAVLRNAVRVLVIPAILPIRESLSEVQLFRESCPENIFSTRGQAQCHWVISREDKEDFRRDISYLPTCRL